MNKVSSSRRPSPEFMKFHRELREASERVISVTADTQSAGDLKILRFNGMQTQEVGK